MANKWWIPDFIERWLNRGIDERMQRMYRELAEGKRLEAQYYHRIARELDDRETRKQAEKVEREAREYQRRAQEIETAYRRGREHGTA